MLGEIPKLLVARWRGLPVYVDVTFILVLFVLFPWRPADLFAPAWELELVPRRFALWIVQVACVFGSVLVHEAAHVLVARHYHVRSSGIQIGGFWGMAVLHDSVVQRRWMIPILAAGPASNALIAMIAWLLLGAPEIGHRLELRLGRIGSISPLWVAVLTFVFQINVALAIVNILPAFPLDGGRIARIVLRRLTSEALAVGAVSACGLVVAFWFMLGTVAYGLTFAVIGFMLALINYGIWRRELTAPLE